MTREQALRLSWQLKKISNKILYQGGYVGGTGSFLEFEFLGDIHQALSDAGHAVKTLTEDEKEQSR